MHARSAIVAGAQCLVAVGKFIASLHIPSLALIWATQPDDVTCFGIYESRKHNCLISHGELLLSRLTHDGHIEWQAGGCNIFTNGFALHEDTIEVIDFENRKYLFDIVTGREKSDPNR